MFTLHYSPGSVSAAVAIILNEVGAPYEKARVNFDIAEQTKPDYHKINPKGRVPALQTGDGILTETAAILDYLAALFPDAELVPERPFDAAKMRSVMTFIASTWHVNHAMGGRGSRWARNQSSFEDMKSKVTENVSGNCDYFERDVFQGPFVIGDRYSLADPYLFTATTWLPSDGVDIADYPRLHDFQTRMWGRPSVQKAKADGFF
ncbi:MAG: glutathione S-transferase family protein [Paracoccaceae bacterium]